MLRAKVAIGARSNLRRFDLAATAPEDVGIGKLHSGLAQVPVDRRFMGEHDRLLHPMRDGHDVDVVKLGAALPPIGVGDNVMAPDLATGANLQARRHGPVKERVIPSHAFVAGSRFDVFQKGREPADHAALLELSSDVNERLEIDAGLSSARRPKVAHEFLGRKLSLQSNQHVPLLLGELDDRRIERPGRPRRRARPVRAPAGERGRLPARRAFWPA